MKKTIITTILIGIVLTGCGIMPTINCDKTANLRIGITEKELINLMGDPYFVSISSKAGKIEKTLGWQNKESPIESTNLIRVKISPEGKVADYSGKCNNREIKSH